MLASRHQSRCRKLRQSSRASSTLKHSSNQNGLFARCASLRAVQAAKQTISVSQRAERTESDGKRETPAFSSTADGLTGASGCGMFGGLGAIPGDTMLGD